MSRIKVGDRIEFTEAYGPIVKRGVQGDVVHVGPAQDGGALVRVQFDSGKTHTAYDRRMRKVPGATPQEKIVSETPALIGFTVEPAPAPEPVQPLVRLPLSQGDSGYSVYDSTGRLLFCVNSLDYQLSAARRRDIAEFLIAAVHEKVARARAGALYQVTRDNVGTEPPVGVDRLRGDGSVVDPGLSDLVRRGTGWWWVGKGASAPTGNGWNWGFGAGAMVGETPLTQVK